MKWIILYADGSTFSNDDGEPHEAPRSGVMTIFQEDEKTGVDILNNGHGYWIWDDSWLPVDTTGFYDHLFFHPHPLVVFGRYLKNKVWEEEMMQLIRKKAGMIKSAWRKHERQEN